MPYKRHGNFNFDPMEDLSQHPQSNYWYQNSDANTHQSYNPFQQQQQIRTAPFNSDPNEDPFRGQNPQQPMQQEAQFNPYTGNANPLMSMLKQRESGGNYGIRNNLGYSGAYQFGAEALEDLGLLKPGSSKQGNSALETPDNWNLPGGLNAYLNDPELQDHIMQKYMDLNKKRLQQMGLITSMSTPQEINAMLAAAHLGGVGGVKAMHQGHNRRDANGTGVNEYYNMGMNA